MATSVVAPGSISNLLVPDNTTVTLTIPALPDGLLIVLVSEFGFGGTVSNITDSAGNNWMTNLRQVTDPVGGFGSILTYINNCRGLVSGTQTLTVTWTAPVHALTRLVWYLQGEMVLDQISVNHFTTPDGNISTPTVITQYDGELIFGYLVVHGPGGDVTATGVTCGAGFRAINPASPTTQTDAQEDFIQTTAGAIAVTFTAQVNSRCSAWIASFRPYGWMQNASQVIGGGTAIAITADHGAVNTAATVILLYGWDNTVADVATITDNASGFTNSYVVLPAVPFTGQAWQVAYCTNVRGHPTTFTIHTPSTHNALVAGGSEYGGNWNFDTAVSNALTAAGTFTAGTLTPRRDGSLVYAGVVSQGSNDATAVSALFRRQLSTILEPFDTVQATAAALSPQMSSTGSVNTFVLSFMPSVVAIGATLWAGTAALLADVMRRVAGGSSMPTIWQSGSRLQFSAAMVTGAGRTMPLSITPMAASAQLEGYFASAAGAMVTLLEKEPSVAAAVTDLQTVLAYYAATQNDSKLAAVDMIRGIQRNAFLLLDQMWGRFGNAPPPIGIANNPPSPLALVELQDMVGAKRNAKGLSPVPGVKHK